MQFSFYGARLKVKRAYKHINELEICFRALVRENINATRVHEDSTPGHESDHVSIRRPKGFSEVVSPIVGDVVHNLRTALDFIAAEIVKNEPECIREISYFPLGGTKNDLISSSRYRFIQRAAPDLASVIADIVKPYKAGGDWRFNAINELDRMDKHRVLVPSVTISNPIVTGIIYDQEDNPP